MWNGLLAVATRRWGRVSGVAIVIAAAWWYHANVTAPVTAAHDKERVCLQRLQQTQDELVSLQAVGAELDKCKHDANTSTINAYYRGYAAGLAEGQRDAKVAKDGDCFVIRPVF